MQRMPIDDAALVEACISGDMRAWAEFVKKYSRLISISIENRIKKYGFSTCGHDIEDIKQDTLAALWKNDKLSDVRNRNDISYWLAITSGNMAVEYLRKRASRQPYRTVSIFDKIGEKNIAELIPSVCADSRDEFMHKELAEKVNVLIESLPVKERLAIRLNLIYDKKYDEIAVIMAMPIGSVSSYIKRAKEKLRQKLKDCL